MNFTEWGAFEVAGENSVIAYLGSDLSDETSRAIDQLATHLKSNLGDLIIELIPSYVSLLIVFDYRQIDHQNLFTTLEAFHVSPRWDSLGATRHIELPVLYNQQTGPDLGTVAEKNNLSIEQVIQSHTRDIYRAYALGFAPGFAYLGQVDKTLATPRLKTPRLSVPAGSVGIADRQTAVYPAASPGGWNIIGCCPIPLFDPDSLSLLQANDTVSFRAITASEFKDLGGTVGEFRS